MRDAPEYNIEIKPSEDADADALAALMHASIHVLGSRAYSRKQLDAWSPAPRQGETARKRFSGQTAFIAMDDKGPAAFMTLDPEGYLDFAYAHPRAAGKGAASLAYDALETFARARGMTELTSDISLIARPFMERRGWMVVRRQSPVVNDVALTNFHMHKELAPQERSGVKTNLMFPQAPDFHNLAGKRTKTDKM